MSGGLFCVASAGELRAVGVVPPGWCVWRHGLACDCLDRSDWRFYGVGYEQQLAREAQCEDRACSVRRCIAEPVACLLPPPMLFREVVGGWVRSVRHRYVGQLGYYFHHQIPALQDWLQLGVRFYDPALGCYTQHGSPYAYADAQPVSLAGAKTKKRASKIPVDTPNRHYLNKCMRSCVSDDDVQAKMGCSDGRVAMALIGAAIGAGIGKIPGACIGAAVTELGNMALEEINKQILLADACGELCSLRARRNGGTASYEYQAFDHWWSIVGDDFRRQERIRRYAELGNSCRQCQSDPRWFDGD